MGETIQFGPQLGFNSGLTFHKSVIKHIKAGKSDLEEAFIFVI